MDVLETMEQIIAASVLAQWRQSVGADVFLFVDDGDGAHQGAKYQFDVVSEIVHLNKKWEIRIGMYLSNI